MDVGTLVGAVEIDDQLSGALTSLVSKVRQFGESFDGIMGALAIGAGVAVTAVLGIAASIVTLGSHGSDINDVAATLDHFASAGDTAAASLGGVAGASGEASGALGTLAGSGKDAAGSFESIMGMGTNATQILQNLRAGTLNTVSDFDLLKTSSKLLSAGVKLTAADFETLGTSAFVMQNRGLGPTKDMLGLVSDAMITGRTKTLAMRLGIVDVGDATAELAHQLGVEESQLTKVQKAEATRTHVLEMLGRANKDAGVQVRDFGEQMEAAGIAFVNWYDTLASSVAKSSHVMGAIDKIGKALQEAFGGAGQTAIEVLVGWIDKFADAVGYYGPIVIGWMRSIIDHVLAIWRTVKDAWDTVPEWFKKMAYEAGLAAIAVGGVNVATQALTGADILTNVASFATIWSGFGKYINEAAVAMRNFMGVMVLTTQIGGVSSLFSGLAMSVKAFVSSGAGVLVLLTAMAWGLKQVYTAFNDLQKFRSAGGSIWQFLTMSDSEHAAFKRTQEALDELGKRAANFGKDISLAASEKPLAPPTGKSPAIKAIEDLMDVLSGAKLQKEIQDNETALINLYKRGITPSAEAYKELAQKADGWLQAGGKLTPVIAEVYKMNVDLNSIIGRVNESLGFQKSTIGGVTGEWQVFALSLAPIPEGLSKLVVTGKSAAQVVAEIAANQKTAVVSADDLRKAYEEMKWSEHVSLLYAYGDGLRNVGQEMGGFIGLTVSGLGSVVTAWADALVAVKEYGDKGASSLQKITSLTSAVAGVAGATGSGSQASRIVGGAAMGAVGALGMAAAWGTAGASLAPMTLGLSVAVGALAGAVVGWARSVAAAREAARKLDEQFDDMHTNVDKLYGSFEDAEKLAQRFGIALADATGSAGHRSQADLERVQRQLDELGRTLELLADDVERYGLSWADLENPADRLTMSNKAAKELEASIKRLVAAGYSYAAITRGMAGDINDWLAATLHAGTAIPAAMRPIIESLIRSGQLTEANARAMLGLAADTMPSLADITEAAERYGLTLDQLGPKVQQLRINEQAKQIVKDFDLLTLAGVDFGVLMTDSVDDVTGKITGMHHEIQNMVLQALGPLGITLPAAMKPIIQKLIEAGGPLGLVDQFGNALTDVGQLNFERPLTDAIDDLIEKLDELIAKFAGPGGLADSIINLPKMPKIVEDNPLGPGGGYGDTSPRPPHLTPPNYPNTSGAGLGTTNNVFVNLSAMDGRSAQYYLDSGGARQLANSILGELENAAVTQGA